LIPTDRSSLPRAAGALASLAEQQPEINKLLQLTVPEQHARGYIHTLREICQQPRTWLGTCDLMLRSGEVIERSLSGAKSLVLTGSGSSDYAGSCARQELQNHLGVSVEAVAGGAILTNGLRALPPARPGLVVSLSRSGQSPESLAAIAKLLEAEPGLRHLVITCNAEGTLAAKYSAHPHVSVIVLDPSTNDRSLVMTSSFTNLVLAARFLGYRCDPGEYRRLCETLAGIVDRLLATSVGVIAEMARRKFSRVIFLSDSARIGAGRECVLKMLEMTAGRISPMHETFLGLRHGPMSFISPDTLVVAFLSSEPRRRAYEADLLREIDRKQLGLAKLVVGEKVPKEVLRDVDAIVECQGLSQAEDADACIVDVVAGQLLAFFRCMHEGLLPDSPSENGIISRVVGSFAIHDSSEGHRGA